MMSEDKDKQPLNIHIGVENFGPIEKAKIDLRPLTVFVGESNTGKTYLGALIYALLRTFEGIPRVPWLYYNTSRFDPIYYSKPADLSTQTLIEETHKALKSLAKASQPFKFSDLPKWVRDRLKCGSAHSEVLEAELRRCFDYESVSELARFTKSQDETMKVSFEVREVNQFLWSLGFYDSGSGVHIDKCVNKEIEFRSEDRDIFRRALDVKDQGIPLRFINPVSTFYYLPAARSSILLTHGFIVSSLVERATRIELERLPATSMLTGMIADFLKHIINYKEREIYPSEIIEISKALENEVLRGGIEANRPAGLGYPQFSYRPLKSEKSLRMNQTSSMVLELAPLVLLLRSVVNYGDTLIMEEPEAHQHPGAQTKIAITLARLVRAGVRVIITTHSDWLLEQIGNLVREGEVMKLGKNQTEPTTWLTEDEVGAWRFHADKPVEEIRFDLITGFEPQDYGEVAEELYNRSVDLRTLLMEQMGDSTGEQE